MIEKKYNADIATVFALLSDPAWLAERALALGDISFTAKPKKSGKTLHIDIKRRTRREISGVVAKVLPAESDIAMKEAWHADDDGFTGELSIDLAGVPVTITGDYSLRAAGKHSLYSLEFAVKCGVPLIGGSVAKFVLGQLEDTATRETDYLANYLKKHK